MSDGAASPSHVNNSLWIFTANQSDSVYLEGGTWAGYNNSNQYGYWLYWGDTNPSMGGQYLHFYTTVSDNGSSQDYEMYEQSYYDWDVWNSTYGTYGYSTHQSGVYSWAWQTGGEVQNGVYPDQSASTFNNYLEVYNGSTWHYPTDFTGGVTPGYGCTGRNNGYCMNGTTYSTGEWSWNIPG